MFCFDFANGRLLCGLNLKHISFLIEKTHFVFHNHHVSFFGIYAPIAEKGGMESIFVKSEYKLLQIELRKILYIEGLKDYVKIFVEDEPRPVLSLMSMKSLEDMLPSDRFVRVHRSFIVQPEKIKVIERNRIVFGKEYIPISDNYKQHFLEMIERRSILPK